MSSSSNIPTNDRSMNGIITISDGKTVLEDGVINTDTLKCDFFRCFRSNFC